MICNNCNKEIPDGSSFCPECGTACNASEPKTEAVAAVEENENTQAEAANTQAEAVDTQVETVNTQAETVNTQNETGNTQGETISISASDVVNKVKGKFTDLWKNNQNIVLAGIGVVAVLLIILICTTVFGNKSPYTLEEYGKGYYWKCADDELINLSGKKLEVEDDIYDVAYSADYSLTVVTDSEDVLWVVDGKKLVEVDEEVYSYKISAAGDAIAYIKDVEDDMGTLYWFSVSKGKSVEVAEDVYYRDYILSPDGETIAYIGDCKIKEVKDEYWGYTTEELVKGELFVSKKGKEGKAISKDASPLAVSDGGKYVFYIKDNTEFCVNKDEIDDEISTNNIFFTEDCKEVLYTNDDGDTMYYTVKFKKPVKVKGSKCYGPLVPENIVVNEEYSSSEDIDVLVYGMPTFNKTVIQMGGDYYFVFDKGDEVDKLVSSDCSYVTISEDGKSMVYLDGGDIKYIKKIKKDAKATELGDDPDAQAIVTSADLKDIFFYDGDSLFYTKKKKNVEVFDDEIDGLVYSEQYGGLYVVSDDELYFVNSKKAVEIDDAEVSSISIKGDEVIFYLNDDDERIYYIMKSKKKFKEFYKIDR